MSLEVKNLKKKYGDKVVVNDLSFTMEKPSVYALLGSNGAGKSTSIRMILGLLDKDGGEVLWNGEPLTFNNCNIGYLAEERGLYPKYTLIDQIKYFAELRGVSKKEVDQRIKYWAKRLEVEEYLYPENVKKENDDSKGKLARRRKPEKPKKADQLSKGNQQKIQFLISMLSDPELIVLDEPFSGLDPVNTDILKSVVRELISAGKYIIMSSHQMEVVEEFCNDIVILSHSNVIVQGNLNEIKKSYGRVNLSIKVEQDIHDLIEQNGITIVSEKEGLYNCKVKNEDEANNLLKQLIDKNVSIIKFDLSELSLHEIFVKEVKEN